MNFIINRNDSPYGKVARIVLNAIKFVIIWSDLFKKKQTEDSLTGILKKRKILKFHSS